MQILHRSAIFFFKINHFDDFFATKWLFCIVLTPITTLELQPKFGCSPKILRKLFIFSFAKNLFGRCPVRASQHHIVEIAQCYDAKGYSAEKIRINTN